MTAQISQIRTVADGIAKFRPTEQNGGSRAGPATSNCHAARLAFQSASARIAEYLPYKRAQCTRVRRAQFAQFGASWALILRSVLQVNGRDSSLLSSARGRCFRCRRRSVCCSWVGLAVTLSSCRRLGGEAVLQAGVTELVDGPDRAQDAAVAGVFEEPHEANRGAVSYCELCKREGG
jgi:hypothetical protein